MKVLLLSLAVFLASISSPLRAQEFADLSTLDKLKTALQINRAGDNLTRAELAKITTQIDQLQASDCLILELVRQSGAEAYPGVPLQQKLQEKLQKQEEMALEIERRLMFAVQTADAGAQAEIKKLARKIASVEVSQSYVMDEVLPFVRDSIAKQQRELELARSAVKIASAEYEGKFRSLCERLDQYERSTRKPDIQEPTPAPPLPQSVFPVAGPRYNVDAVTPFISQYCTQELIHQCYDHVSTDPSGRSHVVHGDVYRSCKGQLILVTHVKTRP